VTPPISEREPFLRAIIEAPDDDAVRLVYSDWLEEHGDIERATYIRTAIQLSMAGGEDPKLEECNVELLKQHDISWLEEAGIDWRQIGTEYSRGLIEEAYAGSPQAFFANAPQLFATAPVRCLTLDSQVALFEDADLIRLAGMPELARLHTLNLWDQHCGNSIEAWTTLFHSSELRNLMILNLRRCRLGETEIRALASSPSLAKLQCVELNTPALPLFDPFRTLYPILENSPNLPSLKEFNSGWFLRNLRSRRNDVENCSD